MTKHSETTGSSENERAGGGEHQLAPRAKGGEAPNESGEGGGALNDSGEGRQALGKPVAGRAARGAHDEPLRHSRPADQLDCPAYDGHPAEHQVTLRTPAELADALPYLLGYRPEDSIVLVALHERDGRGRFGGRARLGIPASADDWEPAARQLAHGLMRGSERRGSRPEQMVAFLCQEPPPGQTGRQVMERLRPLAQQMRVACGSLDVPVIEALCISDGRFWSFCCDKVECCPPEGRPMGLPGTSVLAAAATYAGLQVRGTLRELQTRLLPLETSVALEQEVALDTVGMALVPRILDDSARAGVAQETLRLAEQLMDRFAATAPVPGAPAADRRDDELLGNDEAARLILGLQDRTTRDRAAQWMEGDEAGPALRLWRALARRCVGPYSEHAAPPLTLAGWVAWSTGDELEAREALAMALGADSDYLFARLLHQACNEGLDPESIRRCLRADHVNRDGAERSEGASRGEGAGRSDRVDRAGSTGRAERPDRTAGTGRAERAEQTGTDRTGTGRTAAVRLGPPEDAAEPVQCEAATASPTTCSGDDGPRPRQVVGPKGARPHPVRAARRERPTRAPRPAPRMSTGTAPGAPRPAGGPSPRAPKTTSPRSPKKGAVRRSGPRPDGGRPENAGAEGDT
ncbi:DUF4192 family protein [Streptomyces sp. M41]|uniref:DUF4192 domain-containing protein n=1 Tax=Streptomyces sp. M41 TaxID=3059412 RepID=UPI00374CEDF3